MVGTRALAVFVVSLVISGVLFSRNVVVADPPFSTNVKINDVSSSTSSCCPTLAVGSTGGVYAGWPDGRILAGDFRIFFAASSDGGATWTTPNLRVGDDVPGSTQGSPSIAVNSTGAVFLAWMDWRNGNADIYFAGSADGGATWTTPNKKVNTDAGIAAQSYPRLAVDGASKVYVVWVDERNGDSDVFVGVSSDGGMTWTDREITVESGVDPQYDPAISIDEAGDAYVVWEDTRNANSDVYFAKSSDGGLSWSNPNVQLTTEAAAQYFPTIAAGSAGVAYAAWRDNRNGNYDIYLEKTADGGASWSTPPVRVNTDTGTAPQNNPSIDVDSSGFVHLAWTDNRNTIPDIYSASSFDAGLSWTNPNWRVNDDPGFNLQTFPALAASSPGRVHIAWQDGRSGVNDVFSAAATILKPPPPTDVHATLVAGGQDVRITWVPSSPEAAVDHYEVWRGNAYSPTGQGYAALPAASNLPPGTTSFTDTATMPGFSHYYIVSAVGTGGSTPGDFQVGKLLRPLSAGMSLLGIPLILQDNRIASVFQSFSFSMARIYDASDPADPWKAHVSSGTWSELDTISGEHAVWVNATAAGEWRIAGRVPAAVSVGLQPGWNLVSYPSAVPRTISASLTGLSIGRAERFDPNAPPYFLRVAVPTYTLLPGSGLWLFSDTSQSWNLTN